MKKLSLILIVVMLFSGISLADVTKTTKSSVKFAKFGKLVVTETEILKNNRRMSLTEQHFKGEGFMGKMVAFFFPKGQTGDIVDLNSKKVYSIQYKKKLYSESDIMPIDLSGGNDEEMTEEEKENYENAEEEHGDDIEVVRNILTVKETGNKKQIAGYAGKEYLITWIYEVINHTSEDHVTDSLVINLWTTDNGGDLRKAQDEEMAFGKKYLGLLGLEFSPEQEEMLGLKWMQILQRMNASQNKEGGDSAPAISDKVVSELQKISGYAVKYAGYIFVRDHNKNTASSKGSKKSTGLDLSNPGKALGGFLAKKASKRNKKKSTKTKATAGFKELLNYGYELKSISLQSVPKEKLQIPSGFKKMEEE